MAARQPELFASAPAPRVTEGRYCDVAVPLPLRGRLTYAVPDAMAAQVAPGVRVVVAVGGQRVVGFVVGAGVPPPAGLDPSRIRPVLSVVEAEPVFPDDLLRFLREAADYYMHPLGEVLRAAAPTIARRAADDDPRDDGAGKKSALKARWSRVREEVYVRLVDPDAPLPKLRGDRQAQVVSILASRVEVSMRELRSQLKNPRAAVEALVQRGLVVLEAREVPDDPFFGAPVPRDEPPPRYGRRTANPQLFPLP